MQYWITNKKRPGLDKNHTHFILVDNGTSGKFGTEIDFRSDFEALVAKQNVQTSSSAGIIYIKSHCFDRAYSGNCLKSIIQGGFAMILPSIGWALILKESPNALS